MADGYWEEQRECRRRARLKMVRCDACGARMYPDEQCLMCGEPGPDYKEPTDAD